MSAANILKTQAPEKMRNTWSLAMRSFTNCRSNCEVENSFGIATTEIGCLMSNASTQDLANIGAIVEENSVHDVQQCLKKSEVQMYTMTFTDSEKKTYEAHLTDEDVDNSFLTTPIFLIHFIFFAASNNAWPTKSNNGLQNMLHAFMNNEDHAIDELLALPSKTYTTSLPLNAAECPQAFKATCNSYELRNSNQQVLQEFAHTQCKLQQLHDDGMHTGHLIMETLSMKDKCSDYTATVQLTITHDSKNAEETIMKNDNDDQNINTKKTFSVHVIHEDAHFTMQMQCSKNEGCRKLHLPAYAALHTLHLCKFSRINYLDSMRNSNLQNLHLGCGIASLVLQSSSTPIVFMMLPVCNSTNLQKQEVENNEIVFDTQEDFENLDSKDEEHNDTTKSSILSETFSVLSEPMTMVLENANAGSTIVMREPQLQQEEAFHASYTDIFQQDPIMRQALYRRSNRDV